MNDTYLVLILGESTGLECFKNLLKLNKVKIKYVISADKFYNEIVNKICKKNKIKFYNLKEFKNNQIKIYNKKNAEFILLSIFSSLILKKSFLKQFKNRCYNIHPGLLPFYPGKNCVSGAIYNSEKETAVTLHLMTEKIDQGEIIMKKRIKINTYSETLFSLMIKLKKTTLVFLNKFIYKISKTNISTYKNDNKKKKNFPKVIPNKGEIDVNWKFKYFDKIFRAGYSGPLTNSWGKVFFRYRNIKKFIVEYKLVNKKKPINIKDSKSPIKIKMNEFIIKFKDKKIKVITT